MNTIIKGKKIPLKIRWNSQILHFQWSTPKPTALPKLFLKSSSFLLRGSRKARWQFDTCPLPPPPYKHFLQISRQQVAKFWSKVFCKFQEEWKSFFYGIVSDLLSICIVVSLKKNNEHNCVSTLEIRQKKPFKNSPIEYVNFRKPFFEGGKTTCRWKSLTGDFKNQKRFWTKQFYFTQFSTKLIFSLPFCSFLASTLIKYTNKVQ